MRRFLLHLKLEAWRVWPWIALWVALLGLRALRFHTAWYEIEPEKYFAPQKEWYLDLLTLLMGVLPFIIMKLDDAGDPKAFWTTRPRTLGDLLSVKLALLFVVVVGGWAGLVAFRLGVTGWPQGCWKEITYEAARASMVVLVAAAIAWGRPGWRQPIVAGAIAVGFWHLADLKPGDHDYRFGRELIVMLCYAAISLVAIVWVLRKRRPVPVSLAIAVGLVSLVSLTIAWALLKNEGSRLPLATNVPKKYAALAASLSDGAEILQGPEENGAGERTSLRIPNPFPGQAMLVEVVKAPLLVDSMELEVVQWARSDDGQGDHQHIDLEIRERPSWSFPHRVDSQIRLRFFRLTDPVVLPLTGGRVDLPGSRTLFGAVQRSMSAPGTQFEIEVPAETTLFSHSPQPVIRYVRNRRFPIVSLPPVGSLPFGYDVNETLSRVLDPGRDILELRHRKTGEIFKFDQLRLPEFEPGRAGKVWHYKWAAFGVRLKPAEAEHFSDAWLRDAELVVQQHSLVDEVVLPFVKTLLPLKSTTEKMKQSDREPSDIIK